MRSYTLGCALVLVTRITDPVTGQPATPTTVTLSLKGPDGAIVTPAVSNTGAGVYKSQYTPLLTGVWRERWASTGGVDVAMEREFEIRPTAF